MDHISEVTNLYAYCIQAWDEALSDRQVLLAYRSCLKPAVAVENN